METSSPENKKKETGRAWKVLREFCAVALWVSFFVKVFVFDFDIYIAETYAPSLRWILNYRFFVLLLVLSAILILTGKKSIRRSISYIILYPIIIIFWQIPKLFFRNWALTIAFAPAIYEVIRSFRKRFIFLSLATCSALCIILSSDPYILFPAMGFLGAYLITMMYRNLKSAYRSSVFEGLADLTKKIRLHFESGESKLFKKVESNSSSAEDIKAYQGQLAVFYLFNNGIEVIAEKLYAVAKSRKPDLYLIVSWLGSVIITSLIYAFEFLAVYKIDPGSFKVDHILTFWNSWGYSFGKVTPSSISTIYPISGIATIISYSETFCYLLIFVILAFSLLTAAREKYKEDIANFTEEVRSLGVQVQRNFSQFYDIALPDVEKALLRSHAAMINWFRRARGLPELPLNENATTNKLLK